MVVLEKEFAESQEARNDARHVMRALGVPDDVLQAAEDTNPQLDWRAVIYALDGVFLSHGGAMGQVLFLRERHAQLCDMTPVEVLGQPGGPSRLCRAARTFARTPYRLKSEPVASDRRTS